MWFTIAAYKILKEVVISDINGKNIVMDFQHTFVMFAATVLVPLITNLNIGFTLFGGWHRHPAVSLPYNTQGTGFSGKFLCLCSTEYGGDGLATSISVIIGKISILLFGMISSI